MRLVDALLRQGHLSEQAIAEAIMTGDRPAHLDRCDLCAERALNLSRALDAVRSAANDAADEAFSAEQLAAQQAQILRRLEQIDEPPRVIAFPNNVRVDARTPSRYRVAPGWIGVAAAAGLIIGAIGGQISARLDQQPMVTEVVIRSPLQDSNGALPVNASLLEVDLDAVNAYMPEPLGVINENTPRAVLARQ